MYIGLLKITFTVNMGHRYQEWKNALRFW